MARLVHIAPEAEAKKIRRNGIAPTRVSKSWLAGEDRFVWAHPVLPSYTITHQWARELKRWGRTSLVTVTFDISGEELIYARHYNSEPQPMTIDAAVGIFRNDPDPRGYEIMIPRRIRPGEIHRVTPLPEAIGWRYSPNAKNKPLSLCDCPMCMPRGEVKASRYRARVRAEMHRRGLKPNG